VGAKIAAKKLKQKHLLMKKITITHAPNTTYITKNEGMIVHNVDNSGVGWRIWGKSLDQEIDRDYKLKEFIISRLN